MTDPTARQQANKQRRASSRAALVIAAAAVLGPLPPETGNSAAAKTPGRVYCYHGVCHRVRAIEEVARLIGDIRVETASFYGVPGQSAPRTSSGEEFNASSRHRVSSSIYPDGTELLIWNPRNGRAAHVRVNDLGPFHAQRTLDLTRGLADDLGFRNDGVVPLKVFVVSAPNHHEARHDPRRVYEPTGGYLGSLDEERFGEIADDLVDRALMRSDGARPSSSETQVAAGTPLPVAETPQITIGAAAADHSIEPPKFTAPSEMAHETTATVPLVIAGGESTMADAPDEPPHRGPAAEPAPSPVVALSLPPHPTAQRVAPPARDTAVREPIRSLSLAASPASRGLLAMALVLTLATLLLARLRRASSQPDAPASLRATPRHIADAAALPPDAAPLYRAETEPQLRLRRRIDPAQIAARRERAIRHACYLADAGLNGEAEATLLRILQDMETAHGHDACVLARPMRLWADCVRDAGRTSDALNIYDRASTLAATACAPDTHELAAIYQSRARLHLAAGAHAYAIRDAASAMHVHAARGEPPAALDAMLLLADARIHDGDVRSAEMTLRELLALAAPHEHVTAARAAIMLAGLLAGRGDAGAGAHLEAGLAALDRHLGLGGANSTAFVHDITSSERAITDAIAARRAGLDLSAQLMAPRAEARPMLAAEITPQLRRAA